MQRGQVTAPVPVLRPLEEKAEMSSALDALDVAGLEMVIESMVLRAFRGRFDTERRRFEAEFEVVGAEVNTPETTPRPGRGRASIRRAATLSGVGRMLSEERPRAGSEL